MSAYVVMIRESVTDQAEMDTYARLALLAREGHDIERLAAYGEMECLEGTEADGVLINRFPSMADARCWYDSSPYATARAHRLRGAAYRVFIVEGVDEQPAVSPS
ncbi:DUF1330 domain-containing protein [Pseudomonas sp. BN605]|uniref:DUF1330 domain-containing protein n=1 Tax=Pseudomonas hunanensis TaxID=1247546 RepID=A0ABD6MYD6_9PSED|nr:MULTISPECIES: DUF1330 domain-containing protein [Pseudomonas]MDH4848002.1 DUF1330 domain-containing protein [Pseudomonas sp. BN605]NWL45568.1 DUF1330 domain-containing protein [Pseudomonas hunanensis]